jgi:cytoskeletal protein RodZ
MDNFEYNYELLKSTREDKKISAQSIAADLCLAERQIRSIEANSNQSFPSASLKFVAVKKYARALGLELKEVINDLEKASKCFKGQKEIEYTINVDEDEKFIDIIKSEIKALPIRKKIQYITNTLLAILIVWFAIELLTNETIVSYVSSQYHFVKDYINHFNEHWDDFLRQLKKYET